MRKSTRGTVGICVMVAMLAVAAHAQTVEPPDVYKAAAELTLEIEQIRVVMGRPKVPDHEYQIFNTEPRHLFLVAQTAYGRVNRLAHELAGAERRRSLSGPEGKIALGDVLRAVDQIKAQVLLVKRALEIDSPAAKLARDADKTNDDTLLVLGDLGRQLNLLLGRTVAWSAIYDRVMLALSVVAGALPVDDRYPALPELQSGKAAPDIFTIIEDCRKLARGPAEKHNVSFLRSAVVDEEAVIPLLTELEAFDLLTILIADLSELTLKIGLEDVDSPPYPRPRNILPSHVYQLLGGLRTQLEALANA